MKINIKGSTCKEDKIRLLSVSLKNLNLENLEWGPLCSRTPLSVSFPPVAAGV